MKKIFFLFLITFIVACSTPLQVEEKGPNFTLYNLEGEPASLSGMNNKVVLLHFWATWCPPCLIELPQLLKFYRSVDHNKIKLMAVCVDKTGPESVKNFLQSWDCDKWVYMDSGGKLARKYGTYRYPETYILDQKGILKKKIIGPAEWSDVVWAQLLQKMTSDPTLIPVQSPGSDYGAKKN